MAKNPTVIALANAIKGLIPNVITSWSATLSDTNVPSEKLVKEYIDEQIGNVDEWLIR